MRAVGKALPVQRQSLREEGVGRRGSSSSGASDRSDSNKLRSLLLISLSLSERTHVSLPCSTLRGLYRPPNRESEVPNGLNGRPNGPRLP